MPAKAKQTTKVDDIEQVKAPDTKSETTVAKETPKKEKYRVKRELSPNMMIPVKNGYQGLLIYKSKRSGDTIRWSEFMDEQDMELAELKSAKASSKAFFQNNWFLIDDPEVLEYLGVTQFYKYALNSKSFDELFKMDPEGIASAVAKLSDGQKRSVAFRAKHLIEAGELDALSTITALEKSLDTELIER